MPLTIKIPPTGQAANASEEAASSPQVSISLQISRTLDGNILINDHQYLDIVIVPKTKTIITIPKPYVDKDVFEYQQDLMYCLFKGGVTGAMVPQGGAMFGVVETNYTDSTEVDSLQSVLYIIERFILKTRHQEEVFDDYDNNVEDNFVDPPEDETTAYGEIPPYQDTPAGNQTGDATYTFAGYGYYY